MLKLINHKYIIKYNIILICLQPTKYEKKHL